MASDRQTFYDESNGEQTISSTTFVDLQTLTFTPDDNSDYIFLATALAQNTSGAAFFLETKFLNDTDTVVGFVDSRSSGSASYFSVCGMLKENYGVSPGSKDFKFQARKETGAVNGTIKELRICAMKLDSADEYSESLGESTTTSGSPQTKVTLTFTPATTGDYLIIFSALSTLSLTTDQVFVRLTHSSTDYGEGVYTPHDAENYLSNVGMVKLNLANSSQTFILTFNRDTTGTTT